MDFGIEEVVFGMTGKRFVGFAAALMAAILCFSGCASEGINSRRRDGVYTVSHQAEASVPVQDSQSEESRPTEEQPEGQTEGQPEGKTKGQSEGQTEVQNEGSSEGQPEGQNEGQQEGQTEGQTAGQPAGQTEGQPGGQTAGQSEGQPEGQTEGQTEGQPEGQAEGQTEGQPEGQAQGQTEGQPEGQAEGQTEGQPEEQGEGQTEGQPEGQPEGQSEDQPEGQAEGKPEGQNEGQTEGQNEGQSEAQSEGSAESQGFEAVIGPSGVNIEELNQKDDTRLVAGYDPNDRDERNRPNKAVNFQEIFGKYNAEFLHGDGQTIMLQFTIGVDNDTIGTILDTLAERGIHAHFFVTGDYAKSHPDVIWRILGEGHILGNHSWAHPEKGMNTLSTQEIIDDSMQMQNFVRETYGYEMREYAFPSGFFCERALATICQLGYHTVFYSFAYNDYMPSVEGDSQTALDRLLRELHPGAIYLLHGSSTMTAGILGSFLDEAAARGYSFVY